MVDISSDIPIYTVYIQQVVSLEIEASKHSFHKRRSGIYTLKQVTSMMRDLHVEAGHEHDAGFTRRSRSRA